MVNLRRFIRESIQIAIDSKEKVTNNELQTDWQSITKIANIQLVYEDDKLTDSEKLKRIMEIVNYYPQDHR